MWDNDGFEVYSRRKIWKGPGLERIMASHNAFLVGETLAYEFWNDSTSLHGSDRSQKLCVASVEPAGPNLVNLKLVPYHGFESHHYSIIYGYNLAKYRGNMEEYRKIEDEEPFPYEPVTFPSVNEMMGLDDNGFIMVYALLMLSYRYSEGYTFPIRCFECREPIRHHLDMRKLAGSCLCPKCFVTEVTTKESSNDFLMRAAQILPNRSLAVRLWTKGVMDDESTRSRR